MSDASDARATNAAQRHFRILIALLSLGLAAMGQSAGNAAIYGEVVDEARTPIRGATIILSRVSGARLTSPFDSRSKITDASGMFSFAGLPGGLFRLCPHLNGSDFVDACEWFDNPPAISLLDGQLKPGVRVVMVRGKLLNIRIDDDEGKLKKDSKGERSQSFVSVKVLSGTRAIEARVSAKDPDGQNHLIVVPIGRPLRLDVSSPGLDVKGKGGAAGVNIQENPSIASGPVTATTGSAGQSFDIKGNESMKQFRFSLKGKAK